MVETANPRSTDKLPQADDHSIHDMEGCRWVFDKRAQTTQQLLQIIREDQQQLQQAHDNVQEDS